MSDVYDIPVVPVEKLITEINSGSNTLLGRPLKFGDVEQIMALKQVNRVTADSEGKTKYKVTYEVQGYIDIEVEAKNEIAAKELAANDFDIKNSLNDLDIDIISISEIKVKP